MWNVCGHELSHCSGKCRSIVMRHWWEADVNGVPLYVRTIAYSGIDQCKENGAAIHLPR